MRIYQKLKAAIIFMVLWTPNFAFSNNFDTIKLDKQLSILNDRAFMIFPTNSAIIESNEDRNWQTSIVNEFGKVHLKFFAIELFRIGSDSLFSEVSRESNSKFLFKRKVLTKSDKLLSIMSTPTIFDSTPGSILINQLIVKTEDNTVFRVEAFINIEGYQNKNQYIQLTEEVFNSLITGTRINYRKSRTEYHQVFGAKKYLKFKLPENYFITVENTLGEFRIHKYLNYTDSNWSTASIGTPPINLYNPKHWGFNRANAIEVKGHFICKEITWLYYEDTSEAKYYKEGHKFYKRIDLVEIVIMANNSNDINELTEIIESIKLKRKFFKKNINPVNNGGDKKNRC